MKNVLRDVLFGISLVALLAIQITKKEIDEAIEQAKERVGPELGELLEAPAMTEEEMDAADEEGDVK